VVFLLTSLTHPQPTYTISFFFYLCINISNFIFILGLFLSLSLVTCTIQTPLLSTGAEPFRLVRQPTARVQSAAGQLHAAPRTAERRFRRQTIGAARCGGLLAVGDSKISSGLYLCVRACVRS
jgi:hypothetical protein